MGTILLAGIYGVGKSTLAEKLTNQTGIPNYSAGDLISSRNGEKYGANKLVADKDKNQDILAEVVSSLLQKHDRILLAGHFCIVNKQGRVDILPESVYNALDIERIILLEAPRDVILSHLAGRDGKEYSETLIQALMDQAAPLGRRPQFLLYEYERGLPPAADLQSHFRNLGTGHRRGMG